jgi:outer membrane protein TolC
MRVDHLCKPKATKQFQAQRPSSRRGFPVGAWIQSILALGVLVVSGVGCSKEHYRNAADRQSYRIVQDFEQKIFGHTNAFTIDTAFSGRDPKSVTPAEILENRQATNSRVLHLDDVLELAVHNSREYQTQKEQLYLTALSLTGAKFEFSPQFFAESQAQVTGSPEGSDIGTVRSQIGVDQLLATGGRLSVSLANDLLRYFTGWSSSGGNSSRDSAINILAVNLSQPLLRGFGRNSPQVEALTQAERNVVYAIRSYTLYQHQFATDIVNSYFSLLATKDNVRNNYTNYLRRAYLTEYTEARAIDRERRAAVDDARASEINARNGYVNSVAGYLNSLASFKLRLGLPISEQIHLDDSDLHELVQVGLIPIDIDRVAGFRMAVGQHMEILNAIDRFEDTKRKVRLAADALKPGLLLTGGATLVSEEPDDYANFDLDQVRYSAGIALDLPVNRLRERNTYRASLISFESSIRSLGLTLDNFKDRIEEGLRTLEQRRLNYLNAQASYEVAERRVEMNDMLFTAGRVQVRDVREAQDQLITSKNGLTQTITAYLQARLQLLLDLGILSTEGSKFWLQDPLAPLLTPDMRGPGPLQMPDNELIPPDRFLEPQP